MRQALPFSQHTLARLLQAHNGIFAEADHLRLARETIPEAPQARAGRTHLDAQPIPVGDSVEPRTRLERA